MLVLIIRSHHVLYTDHNAMQPSACVELDLTTSAIQASVSLSLQKRLKIISI